MPSNTAKERESELAAVWGTEVTGSSRRPHRRRSGKKSNRSGEDSDLDDGAVEQIIKDQDDYKAAVSDDDDTDAVTSGHDDDSDDNSSVASSSSDDKNKKKQKKKNKDSRTTKQQQAYRLHCFIDAGITKVDVMEAFEQYEPKVELRVTQKGNALDKVQYAILTFRNKPMALHAVKTLYGTNQRDTLGMRFCKLDMMLSREQSKIVRRQKAKKAAAGAVERRQQAEEAEAAFVRNFVARLEQPH